MARGRRASSYTREGTEEVRKLINKLLVAFKGKFHNVNGEHIDILFKDGVTSRNSIDVKLIKGLLQAYSDKFISLVVDKGDWESSDEYQRAFLLYEQLLRIGYDDEKRAYRLNRYDVETFQEVSKDFGIDYERAKEVFDRVLNVDSTVTS